MLTLNIEDDSIKLALVKGKRVLNAVEAQVTPGAVQNGVVMDKQGVSKLISGLLSENAITGKDVVACVSGIHSIYRVVSVPKLDSKLLTEVARKEMERVSPVPLDTLYIAWKEVRLSGAESALCLMGLPHENVDSVLETAKLSGLKVKSVQLKPLVVARVIDEKTAAVVNVQTGGFDITVVDNTVPELIRSLSFPSETMTELEKMAVIKEELARTVNFYNSSHAGKQLNESMSCFLSGIVNSGLLPELGYKVKQLPEPIAYQAGVDKARFAANTGLALGETGDANRWMRVTINVLPRIVKTEEAPRANAAPLVVLILGVCIIVAMIFINGTAAKETARLQLLVNEKTKQVTDIQKLLRDDRDKIVKQRDDLKTTLTQLKSPLDFVNANRAYINGDIGQVISALPGVMFLTTIDDNGDSVTLEGLAPDTDTIIGYARTLRQTGLFKQVTISGMQNLSYNDMKFTIFLGTAR
jgi:Tfp pilus assembly protein PilN